MDFSKICATNAKFQNVEIVPEISKNVFYANISISTKTKHKVAKNVHSVANNAKKPYVTNAEFYSKK